MSAWISVHPPVCLPVPPPDRPSVCLFFLVFSFCFIISLSVAGNLGRLIRVMHNNYRAALRIPLSVGSIFCILSVCAVFSVSSQCVQCFLYPLSVCSIFCILSVCAVFSVSSQCVQCFLYPLSVCSVFCILSVCAVFSVSEQWHGCQRLVFFFLTCAQMLMHAIAHEGSATP